MAHADKWTERFGISSKDLAPMESANDAGNDPLRWCLMNGKVPESEYIDWAMSRYELPSVNGDFFTIAADSMFWERVKDLYDWNVGFFPLADWEGVLMIGCLEPPKNFQLDVPHQFVLASARHLLLLWNTLNPRTVEGADETPSLNQKGPKNGFTQSAAAPSVAKVSSTPKSTTTKAPVVTDQPEGISISFDLPNEPSKKEQAAAPNFEMPDGFMPAGSTNAATGTAEMPDGFSFEAKPGAAGEGESQIVELPDLLAALPDGITSGGNKEISFDFTTEFATPQTIAKKVDHTQARPPVIDESNLEKTFVTTPPVQIKAEPTKAAATPPTPKPAEAPRVAAPSVAPAAEQKAKPEVKVEVKAPQPAPKVEVPPVKAKAEPVAQPTAPAKDPAAKTSEETKSGFENREHTRFTLSTAEPRPFETCNTLNDVGAVGCAHILKHFNGAMILLFDGETLKPWKWTDLLTKPQNKDLPTIELQTPSMFRIVHRTRLPYHGHVAASAANNKFFQAFHDGRAPKHVTITPMFRDRTWVGMIMGVSNAEVNYKQSLRYMETLAKEIASHVERVRGAKAA